MEVIEMEYIELISKPAFKNKRFGIRIKTSPKTYEEDFAELVTEVKIRLQQIINMEKENDNLKL